MRFITGLVSLFVALFAVIVVPVFAASGPSIPAASSSEGGDGAKPASNPVVIHFRQPVVFTLSLGKDATTNAEVAVALAARMKRNDDDGSIRRTTFVPEGGWGLADFLEQCKEDPYTTLGAIMVLPATFESRNDNYLVMIRSVSTLQFNALVATCTPAIKPVPVPTAAPHGDATDHDTARSAPAPGLIPAPAPTTTIAGDAGVDYVSNTAVGMYGRSVIQFTPLAVLTSVYLAFAPQRLYQTVGTRVFPTPNPLPAGGAQNSVVTTSQTTLNPSGTATLQNSVVNTVGVAELLFGRSAGVEHYTMHAAEDAATQFVEKEFRSQCGADWGKRLKAGVPTPSPSDTPTAVPSAWFNRTPAPLGSDDLRPAPAASPPAFCNW